MGREVLNVLRFNEVTDRVNVYQDGAWRDIAGDGATSIDASAITSGVMNTARLGSGSALSSTFLRGDSTWQAIDNLNASVITAGTIATARLGSGVASSSTYLRGDGTWATIPPGGTSGIANYEPSDPTGASDMTSELEQYVMDNQGKEIWIQEGVTIKLNSFGSGLGNNDDVVINARNATILYDAGNKAVFVDNTNNASSEVSVSSITTTTVNTDARVSQVTLSSTLSVEAFDVVAIYSSDANPAISGGKLGEIIQVMTDEAALVFNTMERLRRTYSTSVKCRKLSKTRKFSWRGGTFRANGDANDAAITSRFQCMHIMGFVDPVIRDVEFDRPWAMCIDLQLCAFGLVENIQVRDIANLASSNGFTYGVRTYGMNYGHTIRNIKVRNGRHPAFTTDGNTSSSTWYQLGIPTNIAVFGITAMNCHGTVVDTHHEGDGIIIDGVISFNPVQLSTSSLTGTLAQLRCANTILRNVVQIGGARVIKVAAYNHGFRDKILIQGVSVMGLADGSDTDCVIDCDDQTSLANKRDITVTDLNVTDIGLVFSVGKGVPITINNLHASKVDTIGDANAGSTVTVGTCVLDYRNNTRSAANYVWKCRSDGTNGGCTVIHTVKPVLIKGAANNDPTHFFDERDTTANKNVYVPGITEYNPSGVNATLLYESGSTTLVQPTSISTNDNIITVPHTITTPGTTGAQTINKAKGRVNFAIGATSLVVTNSLVTANSMIVCNVASNDATATIKNVVPTAGSFTIRLGAGATAETPVDFYVIQGY